MTFQEVVIECLTNEELVKQFNRLEGCELGKKDIRSPIVRMIDEATGYKRNTMEETYKHEDIQKFISFVFEFIWLPLIMEKE